MTLRQRLVIVLLGHAIGYVLVAGLLLANQRALLPAGAVLMFPSAVVSLPLGWLLWRIAIAAGDLRAILTARRARRCVVHHVDSYYPGARPDPAVNRAA